MARKVRGKAPIQYDEWRQLLAETSILPVERCAIFDEARSCAGIVRSAGWMWPAIVRMSMNYPANENSGKDACANWPVRLSPETMPAISNGTECMTQFVSGNGAPMPCHGSFLRCYLWPAKRFPGRIELAPESSDRFRNFQMEFVDV